MHIVLLGLTSIVFFSVPDSTILCLSSEIFDIDADAGSTVIIFKPAFFAASSKKNIELDDLLVFSALADKNKTCTSFAFLLSFNGKYPLLVYLIILTIYFQYNIYEKRVRLILTLYDIVHFFLSILSYVLST